MRYHHHKNYDIYQHGSPMQLRDDKPFTPSYSGRLTPLEAFNYITGLNWSESSELRAKLPALDQDMLNLLYEKNKTQGQTAAILGLTQGNISNQLKHIWRRLDWLSHCATIKVRQAKKHIPGHGRPSNNRERILELVRTGITKQTIIAEKLNICQATVHCWFRRLGIRPPQTGRAWSMDRIQRRTTTRKDQYGPTKISARAG
jgi:hypothetical protein